MSTGSHSLGERLPSIISEEDAVNLKMFAFDANSSGKQLIFNGTFIVQALYVAAGLLIGRSPGTIAVLLTMTLSTSMAAREGPVPMVGHQICLQVWLAVSLLNDAVALVGQVTITDSMSWCMFFESFLRACILGYFDG
ncbi:hypothetical protein J5N97_020889 [Dioscorea zingiberensis]|uniref:Uncharacterized protein n=1 Tax=Dioscorea zingiberensis TaxID=325984 RepID=A0A9D5HE24_9LILI|nr:hypothetical protein J5N97_020889 [Dioscorea zingiberensis]